MENSESKFWLNNVIEEVVAKFPEGKVIVSSGISPSASYHIGHFREVLSADLVRWGLNQRGREVEHIHVVDNFDPLRKRYDFLPEEYEQFVGWPICLVPDPDGCHDSYAEHYFQEFFQWVEKLNVPLRVVRSYQDLYKTGAMALQIEKAVEQADKIKQIMAEVANRDLPDDWMPLQLLSDEKSFEEWRFDSINTDERYIVWRNEKDETGRISYNDGRVKLNWRLDWPARWGLLGVQVEPHGFQEHGAAGGSYETGVRFAREVFDIEPPIPGFQYGHVHIAGDPIKMSSSKGNLITPSEAFRLLPPEMLRYFYARFQGKKRIEFDSGLGLFRMMDEFSEADAAVRNGQPHEYSEAFKYAVDGLQTPGMSEIPFSHLVTAYQSALGDDQEIRNILSRSGYSEQVVEQAEPLKRELGFVKTWLAEKAPPEVRFELKKELPDIDLSEDQKKMLSMLSDAIATNTDTPTAEWYHTAIHDAREACGLPPADGFAAVYKSLLDRTSGPKAGWYLSILDKDWLVERFKAASKA